MTAAPASALQVEPSFDVFASPGQLVQIAPGRRLNLRCEGSGDVTILFESGLGFPSYSWRKVQPRVAPFARACSYDRAGLGFSNPGPMPRRASAIADDLEALVRAAGLRPPFILVGSSLGSQSLRLFAFRRPRDVAGLVLVDPYVEGQYAALSEIDPGIAAANARGRAAERQCLARLQARSLSAAEAEGEGCIAGADPAFSPTLMAVVRRQRLDPASARTVFSESEMLETGSEDDVRRETRSLGSMPLVVLTAGESFGGEARGAELEARLLARWRALHETLARLSSTGRTELVPGAGHVIQSSHPQVVADTIWQVVREARLARLAGASGDHAARLHLHDALHLRGE